MEGIKWRSYDGKQLYIHEMTHEHISSLYYFMKYVSKHPNELVTNEINRVITEKYSGVVLPYYPHSGVIGEAERLYEKGLLKYDKENHKFNIVDNGEWIGEMILNPEQEVDESTGMFKIDRLAEYKRQRQDELMKILSLQVQGDIKWNDITNPDDKEDEIK
jgi:hypothetical protein